MEKEFYTELVDPFDPCKSDHNIATCMIKFLEQLKNHKYVEYYENSLNPEYHGNSYFEKVTINTLFQERRAFKAFLEICSELLQKVNEIEEENNKNKQHNLITEIEYFNKKQKKILSIYDKIENKKCLYYSLYESLDGDWEENKIITKSLIVQCFNHFVKSCFAIPLSGQTIEDRVHINFISKEAKEKAINQFQDYLINNFHFTMVDKIPDED